MRGRRLFLFLLICLAALAAPSAALAHGIHGEAETIPEFIRLGIRHMVGGWDHLLFIAGVVLLAGQPAASGSRRCTRASISRTRT